MITKFIEVTNEEFGREFNHGKFMLSRFTQDEWARMSTVDERMGVRYSLLSRTGWSTRHIFVLDLETGEGAMFKPGGFPKADLDKHRIWVCPLFEPFLEWLYQQDLGSFDALPPYVHLKDAPSSMQGYRRPGPTQA